MWVKTMQKSNLGLSQEDEYITGTVLCVVLGSQHSLGANIMYL